MKRTTREEYVRSGIGLLKPQEMADELTRTLGKKISKRTLLRLTHLGAVPYYKIGTRTYRYDRDETVEAVKKAMEDGLIGRKKRREPPEAPKLAWRAPRPVNNREVDVDAIILEVLTKHKGEEYARRILEEGRKRRPKKPAWPSLRSGRKTINGGVA